jgi:hypothetical protein
MQIIHFVGVSILFLLISGVTGNATVLSDKSFCAFHLNVGLSGNSGSDSNAFLYSGNKSTGHNGKFLTIRNRFMQNEPFHLGFNTGNELASFSYDEKGAPYPRQAAIYSAILPGLGQAYNRKFLKIPVIYLAGAGLYWGASFNHAHFTSMREAYQIRISGGIDDYSELTENQLINAREFYRRNRDLYVIGMGVLYILNIIDAYVDAHLYEFEISDTLTLRFQNSSSVSAENGKILPGHTVILTF